MYLQAGSDALVDTDEIIGIFDMDNTTVSRQGRNFLPRAQQRGQIINSVDDLPKSYVLTSSGGETKIYISSVSSRVLSNRSKTLKIIL